MLWRQPHDFEKRCSCFKQLLVGSMRTLQSASLPLNVKCCPAPVFTIKTLQCLILKNENTVNDTTHCFLYSLYSLNLLYYYVYLSVGHIYLYSKVCLNGKRSSKLLGPVSR
uniref:Uncharacterized protein n=1 Tax=Micrurus surinamensis TaxID=129470 RepID=A0A2D4PIA3_MICSU